MAVNRKIPGPKAKKIVGKMKKVNGGHEPPYPLVLSGKGNGCYCQDIDGNKFLDMTSLLCTTPLGFNHPRIMASLKKHFSKDLTKIAGQDAYLPEHLELIEEIIKTAPKNINAAFISNSGAEAVENALKISYYKKRGTTGISFQRAFHGRTTGALSLTNSKSIHKNRYPLLPALRLPYGPESVQALERIIEQEGAENISFLIFEPVQGEGGYYPAGSWLETLAKKASKQGITIISDEVQAGLGRTGKWWACEHYNIKPDVITSGKGLQVGATLANKKLFPPAGGMSSTFGGGDLIAMAVGIEIIRTIREEKLLDKNRRTGEMILRRMKEYEHRGVTGVEGLGLMTGFGLPTTRKRDVLVQELFKQGVLTLPAGANRIRLSPPYVITEKEVDYFFQTFDKTLAKTLK